MMTILINCTEGKTLVIDSHNCPTSLSFHRLPEWAMGHLQMGPVSHLN